MLASKLPTAALALTAVVLGSLAASTNAATISVDFQGLNTQTLASTDATGAVSSAGWMTLAGKTGTNVTLNDSTGAATSVKLSYNATGVDSGSLMGPQNNNSNDTPMKKMYGGALGINYGAATLNLSGLDAFSTYDIYVYYIFANNFPERFNETISAAGTTYYVAGINNPFSGWVLSNTTTYPGTHVGETNNWDTGNYVRFLGLSGATQTVNMNFFDGPAGLAGFQIVGTPVPEPTTIGLAGIAVLGLLARRKRHA